MLAVLVGSSTGFQASSKVSLSKLVEAAAPAVAAAVLVSSAMPAFAGEIGAGEQVSCPPHPCLADGSDLWTYWAWARGGLGWPSCCGGAVSYFKSTPSPRAAPFRTTTTATTASQVFSGNCAACHAGGQNVIMPDKTLEQEALTKYLDGGFNEAAVVKQVTNGKNAMPAFGGRLSDSDIANVASYVIATSKAGWD